jgi:cupin fold WbuC family metalloprotein
MQKIYSKISPNILLHIISRIDDVVDERLNISPEEEFIQLAVLKMNKGKTFEPHKHIWKPGKEEVIAQESWVVIRGKVEAILYDLDDSIIDKIVLAAGDCSLTFRGGHNYVFLEDDTVVYEYKTGPYTGQENDKEFIK